MNVILWIRAVLAADGGSARSDHQLLVSSVSGSLFTKLLRYVSNQQFVYKSCAISMSAQCHEVFIDSQAVDQRPKSLSNSVSGSRRTIGRP